MNKRGWLFWLAVFTASLLTIVAASFYLVLRGIRGAAPEVRSGSEVVLDLALAFPDAPLYELGGGFLSVPSITFRDLLNALDRAKTDARVEKLVLHVRGTSLGWAHATELRERMIEFKSSGKPLVAFIEYASNRDYYLASAADEIYIHPRSILDLRGVRAELMFFGRALAKLGVEPEFERVGKYKDAPDVFLRNEMTEDSREAIGDIVESVQEVLLTSMVEGRGMPRERAEELVAQGPFTAEQARELGLVDGIAYLDEVQKGPGAEEGAEKPPTISIVDYSGATSSRPTFGADARIAVIYGIGTIAGGTSTEDAVFGRVMGSDTIAQAFRAAREDDSIDAVVFRIDSPGGSDVASDVIWREASLTKEKKPVIVSMGELAASGGYWVATASDFIVAEPTTITGSIGIFAGKFNLSGLFDKLGIGTDGVSTAENADFFSASRSFTPEERERLRAILESGYQAFLERVSEARGKTVEEVDEVAQGRVWSGRTAIEKGLVDEIGGLDHAIDVAKTRAGFGAEASVEVRVYPERRSFLEFLLKNFTPGSTSLGVAVTPRELVERSPVLKLAARGAPLAILPYQIEIR